MPMYDYLCAEGHRFERMVSLSRFDDAQQCQCGELARRQISAPMVLSDCMAPKWGADGKLHDSRASWERATDAKGEKFYPLDPGEGIPKGETQKHDEKQLRDDIRAGIEDVKYGRVAPPVVLED
jgi:putative FmdB family regulatory protein